MKICPVGAKFSLRTDRQTDMTMLLFAFHKLRTRLKRLFAKAPHKPVVMRTRVVTSRSENFTHGCILDLRLRDLEGNVNVEMNSDFIDKIRIFLELVINVELFCLRTLEFELNCTSNRADSNNYCRNPVSCFGNKT